MPGYELAFDVAVPGPPVDLAALEALAERVMEGESIAAGTGLSVLITGDDEIRDLNRRFLGVDEPTDVLSFPDEADGFVQGADEEPYLGDIAISVTTAKRQAEQLGHSLDAELAHLLVHGILHLCGYEHEDGGEPERIMRAREEHYLGEIEHGH